MFDYAWWVAATDSAVFNLILAAGCALISYLFSFYRPSNENYAFTLSLTIGLTIVCLIGSFWLLKYILSDQVPYLDFLSRSLPIRFCLSILIIGWVAFLSLLWYSQEEKQEMRDRKDNIEKMAREAELFKLRQQLQPHFLFNSLNSISALVITRPEEARNMIQQLSDFLRGTLKKEDQQSVSITEELQVLQLYLEIEKVRFRHRLNTVIELDQEASNMQIPPMLLQPVVENAIKYGLYDTTEAITISINVTVKENLLIIKVVNPYDQSTSSSRGTGFGLSSIARRLYLLFARNDLIETQINHNQFITTLKIPQKK